MIPLFKPYIDSDIIKSVSSVLKSRWLGLGKECQKVEELISKLTGFKFVITLNSATAGLHIALKLLNISENDEVILPALTFVSDAMVVKLEKATPVFADIKRDSLIIDWEDVNEKITDKTRAIIGVDFAGFPSKPENSINIPIIQDASHCMITMPKENFYGDFIIFSFHPVKHIGTGDGGILIVRDEKFYEQAKTLRWLGISKNTFERINGNINGRIYEWEYDVVSEGFKYHWNDLQASIARVFLEKLWHKNFKKRKQIVDWYFYYMLKYNNDKYVKLPAIHKNHSWLLFIIRTNHRDELRNFLLKKGIITGVHYKPITKFSLFKEFSTPPITNSEWKKLLTLPLYIEMKRSEVKYICKSIAEFFK